MSDLSGLARSLVQFLKNYFVTNPTDGTYRLGNGTAGGSSSIELGSGNTGNRYAYIDLIGDDTYTDFGLRLIRQNSGPNASSQLSHRGTGTLEIATVDGGNIRLISTAFNWAAPTLTNSWANWGGTAVTAGYFKDAHDVVHLKGLVKSGGIGAAIFTLPVGFRPTNRHHFSVLSNNGGTLGACYVDPDGTVVPFAGSNVNISLDGITFRIDA